MKDKILEILGAFRNQESDIERDEIFLNSEKAASEIADMVKAFTTWLIIEQEIFMGELSEKYIINDNIHVNGKRLETLDELFNYWYDNIKDK